MKNNTEFFGKMIRTIGIDPQVMEAAKGQLRLGVVRAKVKSNPKFTENLWQEELAQTIDQVQAEVPVKDIANLPQVVAYREAQQALGRKQPSKVPGSHQSLLKRVDKPGNSDYRKLLYQINTVVDTNNMISLAARRSVGSYNLANLEADITFRAGLEGETYKGTTNRAIDLKNLTVLADSKGPFGSPYSDSDRALIGEDVQNFMMVIFGFDGEEGLEEQLQLAKETLGKYTDVLKIDSTVVADERVSLDFKNFGETVTLSKAAQASEEAAQEVTEQVSPS